MFRRACSRASLCAQAAHQQRGVALITALLVVALATTAAVAMSMRQQLDIRRAANLFEYDQAMLYVVGIEDWAGQVLRRDAKDGNVDHLGEDWATQLPPIPVDGGQLAGKLEDLQGRFNVNSLVDASGNVDQQALAIFNRLLQQLDLESDIGNRLADWLDADDSTRIGGAEDVEYLGLEFPYRAGNRRIASPTELRLLLGMTSETWAKLEPYVAAVPATVAPADNTAPVTMFNVNTIPVERPELIMALADGIGAADAAQVLAERPVDGWPDVQSFLQSNAALNAAPAQRLAVKSNYFVLTSHVQIGRSVLTHYSLLERGANGATRTLMRGQGTL